MESPKICLHCRGVLDWIWLRDQETFIIHCRLCHCRFDLYGHLLRWGARCPRLTRKKLATK